MDYCNSGIDLCSVTPGHAAILNHRGSVSLTVHVSLQQLFHRNILCDLTFLNAVLRTKKIHETIFYHRKYFISLVLHACKTLRSFKTHSPFLPQMKEVERIYIHF